MSISGTGAGAAKSRKMINDSSHNLMMVTLLVCVRSGNENTANEVRRIKKCVCWFSI